MSNIQVTAAFARRWSVLWATSYTFEPIFFESFLLPRLGDPPLNVTVLADRHRLAETWQDLGDSTPWRGSRANRDYLVRGVDPTNGAFHPKTYLLADGKTGVLFVGSGNLSMNGLESGKEVFSRFDASDEAGLEAIRAWRSWMDEVVVRIDDDTVRGRWNAAQRRSPWLVGPSARSAFVSNWDQPMLDHLLDGLPPKVDELHAREGFYDDVIFHRVIPGFMIQGGDPTGTGRGGPGYKFADEPVSRSYQRGILAMANAGPNTNGSQFFVMHADYGLPPNYTIFGKLTSGEVVLDKIAAAPTGANDRPVSPVTIKGIEITET